MTTMHEILAEVSHERAYQKLRWGDDHDQAHELEDWLRFIDERLAKLHREQGVITAPRRRALFVAVAALAVAAVEALEEKYG